MDNEISDRIIDQRCRNRIIEVVETLAEGDEGVRGVGAKEYFEQFYDWLPHRDDGGMHANGAMTEGEQSLLAVVSGMLDDACDATPGQLTEEQLIASGWPRSIQPFAKAALAELLRRGRFSEEREEIAPGSGAWRAVAGRVPSV